MCCLQQWKEEVAHEVRDHLILLSTAHPCSQLSPAFQRVNPEHQTIPGGILWLCPNANVCCETPPHSDLYQYLRSHQLLYPTIQPFRLCFISFTIAAHWCCHSPLKIPVQFSCTVRPCFALHFPKAYSSNFLAADVVWIPHRNCTPNTD